MYLGLKKVKMMLTSKVVKSDMKIIIFLRKSKSVTHPVKFVNLYQQNYERQFSFFSSASKSVQSSVDEPRLHGNVLNILGNSDQLRVQVSISPTFYEQLFHTKAVFVPFFAYSLG